MDEGRISSSERPAEFKACLFTLCIYHSLILGRRRFGQQGWSRKYSFNMGDLTVCSNVLFEYINANPQVPWDDLRYIFGEIMYGGHITVRARACACVRVHVRVRVRMITHEK